MYGGLHCGSAICKHIQNFYSDDVAKEIMTISSFMTIFPIKPTMYPHNHLESSPNLYLNQGMVKWGGGDFLDVSYTPLFLQTRPANAATLERDGGVKSEVLPSELPKLVLPMMNVLTGTAAVPSAQETPATSVCYRQCHRLTDSSASTHVTCGNMFK